MENLYLGRTNDDWIRDFAQRMEYQEYNSEDYKKSQKVYRWLCARARLMDRVRIEEIKN